MRAHLEEQTAADRDVLFLHNAGLMALRRRGRAEAACHTSGGAQPRAYAPRPLAAVPAESAAGSPYLDRLLVEVVELSEQVRLDGDFLNGLRGDEADAA